ncbi:MAG: insulinase family protein [Elusimicrobia bacterium]|nr:insulinase family protein [Elusimicrobiota bacterium]
MTWRRNSVLLALWLAAPAGAKPAADLAPDQPDVLETPLPGDSLGVTVHRLANGLTVYLSPSHDEPRVAARIAVRAGSKNDPSDSTGIAHYLEHMLFKGTQRLGTTDYAREAPHLERIRALYDRLFGAEGAAERALIYKEIDAENGRAAAYEVPNEIAKLYKAIGARGLNAHTSDEETIYEVDLPSNRLEAWAALESERFEAPVFRLFQTELEAVYEEKNRSLDNADQLLFETLERRLYRGHPYGVPILGTIEHLKNPSLSKMYAFYRRWYVPNNMALVLSGDFDRARALDLIRRRFGSWVPAPLPDQPAPPRPALHGEERAEIVFPAEESVLVAWPAVPASDPDAEAVRIMDMLADNAAAGLFNLRLNQAQKVKAAWSTPVLHNDAGAWYAGVLPKKDQTPEEALALLLQAVEALKNGEFDDADVAAVITDFEVHEKRALESNEARADRIAKSFIRREPWPREVERLERLRRVTRADVTRVARRLLGPGRVVVVRRGGKPEIPGISKPGFTRVDIDPNRSSPLFKALLALPAPPIEPRWLVAGRDYQIRPIDGGRLYAAPNPVNDLFQVTIRFPRGWRRERRLCSALNLLTLSGAGPYSAEEFKRRLYALGSSLSYSCGEQESGVTLEGLDRNLWPSLELMAQRFDWPNVSSGTLARMADVELGARRDEKLDPGAVHGSLGEWAARGKDSAVLGRLSNAELARLRENALIPLIRDFPQWTRRVGYVGPRPPLEVAKLLQTGRPYREPPPRAPLRRIKPARDRVLFTHRDMVQSRIGLYAADEVFDPETVVDALFYSEYMGSGMSSVIFQEVREARSLAYYAEGGRSLAGHAGDETQLWGQAGCQADKTYETAELMRRLLRGFQRSEPRFREAARAIEERYRAGPIRFRAVPGALMDWEDQGLSADPRPARFTQVLAYTPARLEAFAARFKDKPMTVWILGSRERAGLDKLKTLGDFEEKSVDALFPY